VTWRRNGIDLDSHRGASGTPAKVETCMDTIGSGVIGQIWDCDSDFCERWALHMGHVFSAIANLKAGQIEHYLQVGGGAYGM